MAETAISWTHRPGTKGRTWNPTKGCSRVSEGCRHCYAERQAARIVRMNKGKPTVYDDLVKTVSGEARWTGVVTFVPDLLSEPLRWREPSTVFVDSMSDLFHESLSNEKIAAVFGVMAAARNNTFIVLTKRAKRMNEWFEWAIDGTARSGFYDATFLNHLTSKAGLRWEDHPKWLTHCEDTEDTHSTWPLPNVWLGVSVENQAAADERIPDLLETPAVVRFLSCEPLLGAVDLQYAAFNGADSLQSMSGIDWVISGCESGPGARPCATSWLRSLRDQCAQAEVPFFLKQAHPWTWVSGERPPGHERDDGTGAISAGAGSYRKAGGVIELPYLDGVQHKAFPHKE